MPAICQHCEQVLNVIGDSYFGDRCPKCGKSLQVSEQQERNQGAIGRAIGYFFVALGGTVAKAGLGASWFFVVVFIPIGILAMMGISSAIDSFRHRNDPKGLSLK